MLMEDVTDSLLEIAGLLLHRTNSILSMRTLKKFVFKVDFVPLQVEMLLKWMVEGSSYPITSALEASDLCKQLSLRFFHYQEQYDEVASAFTETAVNLIESIKTDHAAAILLDEDNPVGDSPLEVALRSQNLDFIGNGRVSRILNSIWTVPQFMKQPHLRSEGSSWTGIIDVMLSHPRRFFHLPLGKFFVEALSFLIFLFVFTAVALQQVTVDQSFSVLETVMWIIVGSFFLGELNQLKGVGMSKYFDDEWNVLDMFIYSLFVGMAVLRLGTWNDEERDSSSPSLSYDFLLSINAILLWVRASFVFKIHPSVGPLLRMMLRMLTDVINFALLMSLFVVGFSVSFYYLLSERSEDVGNDNYSSVGNATLTMFRAMVGDFDYGDFEGLDRDTRIFCQVLMSVYISISAVILLNMLIAMMSETYGDVQDQSILQYQYGRATVIKYFDDDDNELPPPLNIFVWSVYIVVRFFEIVFGLCNRRKRRGDETTLGVVLSSPEIENDESDISAWYDNYVQKAEKNSKDGVETMVTDIEFDRLEAYYCARCHHENPATTYEGMQRSIASFLKRQQAAAAADIERELGATPEATASRFNNPNPDVNKEEEDSKETSEADLINVFASTCMNCYRQRKEISATAKRKETISFYIFMLVLYLPLLLITGIPLLFSRVASRSSDVAKRSHRERMDRWIEMRASLHALYRESMDDAASKRFEAKRSKKAAWVKENFHVPDPTLESISEKLDSLLSMK